MKYSRYLKYKERNEVIAIYHELHPLPIFFSLNFWLEVKDNVSALSKEAKNELFELKLLVSDSNDDIIEYTNSVKQFDLQINNFRNLYLILTQDCNFKCSYCPIPNLPISRKKQKMDIETAIKSFKLWESYLEKYKTNDSSEYNVILYGGEPMLNGDLLQIINSLYDLCKNSKLNINIILATNAYLINDFWINILKNKSITVAIGYDGESELVVQNRVTDEIKCANERVLTTIKSLVEENISVTISMTILPSNIESIHYQISHLRQIGVKKVGLNLLKGDYLYKLYGKEREVEYYEKASDIVISNSFIHKNLGYEYLFEEKYRNFYNKTFFPVDCSGYGNQLAVFPDGNIGNCGLVKENRYNVLLDMPSDFSKLFSLDWLYRLPLYNYNCKDCSEKSLCGGGCGWSALSKSGKIDNIDLGMCILNKKVFNFLLWDYFDNIKPNVYE